MKLEIGDEIVWTGNFDDPDSLRRGIITKVSKDFCWVDKYHKPEDCIYQSLCWPGEFEGELRAILEERAQLKKAYDDSMKLIYQLRNKITRMQTGLGTGPLP